MNAAQEFANRHATNDQLIEVILCESQAKEINAHPGSAEFRPQILGATTLGDLLRQMQADEKHERLLEALCAANRNELEQLRQPVPKGKLLQQRREEHRLDCYVWPRYTTEVLKADTSGEQPHQVVERLPVPGSGSAALDHLLEQLLDGHRDLVIHDDAGAGKTVFTYQCLEALSRSLDDASCLFARRWPLVIRFHGHWPSRTTSQGITRLTIREAVATTFAAQIREYAKAECSDEAALKSVDYALQQRRVVIIVDGFDQCSPEDRTHLAGMLNPDTTQDATAAANAVDASHCRWIFAGRSYVIQSNTPRLFDHRLWTYARIERFNQQEWEQYFRISGDGTTRLADRWREMVPNPQAVQDLLGLPLVLREIRSIIEDPDDPDTHAALPVFWTEGQLHDHASKILLTRALRQKGLETDSAQLHRLCEVISLLAFQMMLDSKDYNGTVANDDAHPTAVNEFLDRARNRWLAAKQIPTSEVNRTDSQRRQVLEYDVELAILEKIELANRAVMDAFNHECRSFRNTKSMEWYAARYLTHSASPEDVFSTEQPAAINFINVPEWSNCWKLAIDMPRRAVNESVMARSLSALFHEPKSGTRPTELMFMAWPLFEYDELLARQLQYVVKDAEGKATRDHGQTLVEQGFITEERLESIARALILPTADKYLTEFRKTSRSLARDLDRHSRKDPPKRIYALPSCWRTGLRWLIKFEWILGTPWQNAPSRIKCQTMLQCPPQSRIDQVGDDAFVGWMGSPDNEHTSNYEKPRHRIRVTVFQMQATAVTRGMYAHFDARCPNVHSMRFASPADATLGDAPNAILYPVICASWYDAWMFCKWLGPDYRLPMECEWEHACRAGTETAYHFGSGWNYTQANCGGNYPYGHDNNGKELDKGPFRGRTTPVGRDRYPCNTYGLFDVHGNVFEWCWDWFDGNWYERRVEAFEGHDGNRDHVCQRDNGPASGSSRVLRGGSWSSRAFFCRSAFRLGNSPNDDFYTPGFRVCRG